MGASSSTGTDYGYSLLLGTLKLCKMGEEEEKSGLLSIFLVVSINVPPLSNNPDAGSVPILNSFKPHFTLVSTTAIMNFRDI